MRDALSQRGVEWNEVTCAPTFPTYSWLVQLEIVIVLSCCKRLGAVNKFFVVVHILPSVSVKIGQIVFEWHRFPHNNMAATTILNFTAYLLMLSKCVLCYGPNIYINFGHYFAFHYTLLVRGFQ